MNENYEILKSQNERQGGYRFSQKFVYIAIRPICGPLLLRETQHHLPDCEHALQASETSAALYVGIRVIIRNKMEGKLIFDRISEPALQRQLGFRSSEPKEFR